jgi:hypothetical protein
MKQPTVSITISISVEYPVPLFHPSCAAISTISIARRVSIYASWNAFGRISCCVKDRGNRACILHDILQPILWDWTAYLRSYQKFVRIARRAKIALSAELDCICRQTTRAPLYNPLHRRRMPAHQAATNCSCEPLRSSPCDMFSSPLFLSPLSDLTRSTALPAVDLPKDPPSGCRAR